MVWYPGASETWNRFFFIFLLLAAVQIPWAQACYEYAPGMCSDDIGSCGIPFQTVPCVFSGPIGAGTCTPDCPPR